MAHDAPSVIVLVQTAGGEQPFCGHGHWSLGSATPCARLAVSQGYASGRIAWIQRDGTFTTAWTWPEDPIEPPEVGMPPDDEPGGYATRRRR